MIVPEGGSQMATPRPLRTSMYVPGNKEDWMRKAPQYGADALILDLEDSVPIPNKAAARELVRKMLEELGGEKPTPVSYTHLTLPTILLV